MSIQTMDNVGIVVADLAATRDFFVELGLRVVGEATVEGDWVDRVLGLSGVRSRIVMLETPDGRSRLEVSTYESPAALAGEGAAPPNTLGLRRIAFTVTDIDAVVERLAQRGITPMGEVVTYADAYRLCYVRGPEDLMLMLAEPLAAAAG